MDARTQAAFSPASSSGGEPSRGARQSIAAAKASRGAGVRVSGRAAASAKVGASAPAAASAKVGASAPAADPLVKAAASAPAGASVPAADRSATAEVSAPEGARLAMVDSSGPGVDRPAPEGADGAAPSRASGAAGRPVTSAIAATRVSTRRGAVVERGQRAQAAVPVEVEVAVVGGAE